MKLQTLILALAIGVVFPAVAVPDRGRVMLSDLNLRTDGDSLRVSFRVGIGPNATRGHNYKLTLSPVLVGGGEERPLRRIEIYGRRVELLDARAGRPYVRGLSTGDLRHPVAGALRASEGDTVEYSASVPLESWMKGAGLRLERWRSGCCRRDTLPVVELAAEEAPAVLSAAA